MYKRLAASDRNVRKVALAEPRRLLAVFMAPIRGEMNLMVGQPPLSESKPVPPFEELPNGTVEVNILQRVSTNVRVVIPKWANEDGLLAELMMGVDMASDWRRANAIASLLKWAGRIRQKADADAYMEGHAHGWLEAVEVEQDAIYGQAQPVTRARTDFENDKDGRRTAWLKAVQSRA